MSQENVETVRGLWQAFQAGVGGRVIRVTNYFTHADALKAAGLSE